ncbi:MAG: pyridoxal-phosphate dependent enzyme [Micavibrio sp.]
MIINDMTDLIGNTPLLKIPERVTGLKNIELYAKMEMLNPFGSVKDRTAWAMVKDDLGHIKSTGKVIYENSSGNTAKSLQAIANIHGIKFRLISALEKVREQKEVLQLMGSEIEEIAGASDCFDPTDPNDPQYLIQRKVDENPDALYFPSQFTNMKNPDFHEQTTAREIAEDLGTVDYFFGGLGTAGSSLGISKYLRSINPSFKSIGVAGALGHFIPGIRNMGQMMESTMFQRDYYDRIYNLTEKDALDGIMTLVRECAILCGPSSGANFTAALRYLHEIDSGLDRPQKAVFIVCDRMEWYISYIRERMPEIFGEQEIENGLHSFDSTANAIVPAVKAEDLDGWQSANPRALIIDTRAAQSFGLFKIRDSINMPQEQFEKWINGQNPFDETIPVLIVCAIGERSRHYAAYLRSMGAQAHNLDGGIMAWSDLRAAA